MYTGMIYLYDVTGEILQGKSYRDRTERKIIQKAWEHLYGLHYLKCSIQIVPDCRPTLVGLEGNNVRFKSIYGTRNCVKLLK